MKDRKLQPGGEYCPCGMSKFVRFARYNEDTDYLNLHFDLCLTCGFETYAHNEYSIKVERYHKWLKLRKT